MTCDYGCDAVYNNLVSCNDNGVYKLLYLCGSLYHYHIYGAGMTCDSGCDAVYNALVNGNDTDVEIEYYNTAYTDAKRLLQTEIPTEFWTWMDENEAAREAILSVTWPVDPEVQ